MEHEDIVLNGNLYISSKKASELSLYTVDHLSRLIRDGIIEGEMIAGKWFIRYKSLVVFIETSSMKRRREGFVERASLAGYSTFFPQYAHVGAQEYGEKGGMNTKVVSSGDTVSDTGERDISFMVRFFSAGKIAALVPAIVVVLVGLYGSHIFAFVSGFPSEVVGVYTQIEEGLGESSKQVFSGEDFTQDSISDVIVPGQPIMTSTMGRLLSAATGATGVLSDTTQRVSHFLGGIYDGIVAFFTPDSQESEEVVFVEDDTGEDGKEDMDEGSFQREDVSSVVVETTPTIIERIVTEPTIIEKTVVQPLTITTTGMTKEEVQTLIDISENELRKEIAHVSSATGGNFKTIALTQRIDTLSDLTIRRAVITDSTFSGTISGITLTDLTGVFSSMSPTDGQVLTYDTANGWQAETIVGGGGGYWTLSGSDIYYTLGNVGIGTTTPATALDVEGVITAAGGTSTEWNTAFGWGNHASAGYLTSYTETDPIFSASAASGISGTDITNWDTAYGWGDHGTEGYLKSIDDTITDATEGSVLFAGASGVLAQDNANFFWDDTNKRLGIGTTSPDTALHVYDGGIEIEHTSTHAYLTLNAAVNSDSGITLQEDSGGRWWIYNDGDNLDALRISSTAGTAMLIEQSNGNVGIGELSPQTKLHIDGGTDASTIDNSGYMVVGDINSTNLVFDNNEILARNNGSAAANLYIQNEITSGNTIINGSSGGGVGIGTSSVVGGAALAVKGDINIIDSSDNVGITLDSVNDSGVGPDILFAGHGLVASESALYLIADADNNNSTFGIVFARDGGTASATESARFDADGNFGIGIDSPTARTHIRGAGTTSSTYALKVEDSSASSLFSVRDDGNVGIGTTTPSALLTVDNGTSVGTYTTSGWIHTSDARYKTDVEDIDNALETVRALRGVSFHWIADPEGKKEIGLIAQEVKDILPEVVVGDDETRYGVAYSNISALLIEAIKELAGIVENQVASIATIMNRLSGHDTEIAALRAELDALRAQMGNESFEGDGPSNDGLQDEHETEEITIVLEGNETPHIAVGVEYNDLGASAQKSDGTEIGGMYTRVDGVLLEQGEFVSIDTSYAGVHEIVYGVEYKGVRTEKARILTVEDVSGEGGDALDETAGEEDGEDTQGGTDEQQEDEQSGEEDGAENVGGGNGDVDGGDGAEEEGLTEGVPEEGVHEEHEEEGGVGGDDERSENTPRHSAGEYDEGENAEEAFVEDEVEVEDVPHEEVEDNAGDGANTSGEVSGGTEIVE